MDKRNEGRRDENFFHQTLIAMSDTFERATGDEKMSDEMRRFCKYFAEELNLIKDVKKDSLK